jgi:AGCS family alanine or glycine:cation symporter
MFDLNLVQFSERLASWVWSVPLFFLLLGCGLIFSIATKFVQWRILTHGYACIRGRYDRPGDTGHINHFQALCAALSATIGLGNIAGVAVAVSIGGPGAVFWMMVVGFFGMTLKFMECSLAVMFRDVAAPKSPTPSAPDPAAERRAVSYGETEAETGSAQRAPGGRAEYEAVPQPWRCRNEKCGHLNAPETRFCARCGGPMAAAPGRGEVRGGPMWYMQKGLVEPLRLRGNPLWVSFKALALLFAAATAISALGQGNMFQGWNVADVLRTNFHIPRFVSAGIVALLVALVIIGGIRRIGQVAARLVPFMCVAYVLGALAVIIMHANEVPGHLAMVVRSAFTPVAEGGAFAGISVMTAFTWGLKRALFSNEAGQGSAAMAHAAARTEEPVREGVVAGIGPFVDTLIICLMSALVMLISGTWNRPAVGSVASIDGNTLVVTCDRQVPGRMGTLYLERLTRVGTNYLAIHTQRGIDRDLRLVKVPIASLQREGGDGWEHVTSVTLDLSTIKPEERATLALGQPAHLNIDGAEMMRFAFDVSLPGFGAYVVTVGVCLFAFSTMISWSYYGEKGAEFLLGRRAVLPYKVIFVIFVIIGMTAHRFDIVYNFSDALCGVMALCNLPAVLLLSPRLLRAARDYFRRLDAGQMPRLR